MTQGVTIGLIADTHVPDRKRRLHPAVLPIFEKAKVSQILHAGDISVPRVLEQLGEIAPVVAVRGNRDWFLKLPMKLVVPVEGRRIGLVHGHGSWGDYLRDKVRRVFYGPQKFEHFMRRAISLISDVDILVFGHNHEPMLKEVDGMLVINPGSACQQAFDIKPPSVALLHVNGNAAKAEIVYLE